MADDRSESAYPELVLYEDDALLVVRKPARLNTHAPSPFAGEGLYEWLRQREPRWASLAIIHRLDKETSGVIVFTKTPQANKSLTEQFTRREVTKRYLLLTDRRPREQSWTVQSTLARVGDKYASTRGGEGQVAQTEFRVIKPQEGLWLIEALPKTGRTHQIRVHAAESGTPIYGDVLYGGTAAHRVCLHAAEIDFAHPTSGRRMAFSDAARFTDDPSLALRSPFIQHSNAFRLAHGRSDSASGMHIEKWGDYLLAQSDGEPSDHDRVRVQVLMKQTSARGCAHKIWRRQVRTSQPHDLSPKPWLSTFPDKPFVIEENGLKYQIRFDEGYSVGLFLDQRDNRRRLLANYIGPEFAVANGGVRGKHLLNTFAYTCGFSVAAAAAGARTTSLDLSQKYLAWGKTNFELNSLSLDDHDFIYGDAFNWMKRLSKKGRKFDIIILDPPTFSHSKEEGTFQAERDYGLLVDAALPLLAANGTLLASTNAARLAPERFVEILRESCSAARRRVSAMQYIPQPIDFPISPEEPAYLKTVWLRVS